jgi:hypothetical protein
VARRPDIAFLVAVALAFLPHLGKTSAAADIAVVVGTASPLGDDLDVDTLRDVYLLRQRLWPNGARALPVNLPPDHPMRRSFSERVLGRRPQELVGYWNRRYFEGVRPPLVLRTPQAICAYLASEPAAVGYVPADDVDAHTCRVVLRIAYTAPAADER